MEHLIENLSNAKIVFGLEAQGHIPTIEKILAHHKQAWKKHYPENPENAMTYSKHVWEQIGKEIGWCPFSAALSYFEFLSEKPLQDCMEENCKSSATKDYNGHGHFVCDRHFDKLSGEFDEEYD